MIRAISQKQLPLSEFKTPFEATMDENNRWVQIRASSKNKNQVKAKR